MAYASFSLGVHVRLWPPARTRLQKGHRHVPPIVKHLFQHSSNGLVGSVGAQDEPSIRIHEVQTLCG